MSFSTIRTRSDNSTTHITPSDLIPWSWRITPAKPSFQCPSALSILVSLLLADIITTTFAFIVGHRVVANFLTCGLLGNIGSSSWKYLWSLTAGINIASNAIVATLIVKESGPAPNLPQIGDFMLFFLTRPRITWILLLLVNFPGEDHYADPPDDVHASPADWDDYYANPENYQYPRTGGWRTWWSSAARQTGIAEGILGILSCYYLGRVAHFFYSNSRLLKAVEGSPYKGDVTLFAGGALLYLMYIGVFVAYILVFAIYHTRARRLLYYLFGMSLAGWAGLWMFWTGYLRLAGNL